MSSTSPPITPRGNQDNEDNAIATQDKLSRGSSPLNTSGSSGASSMDEDDGIDSYSSSGKKKKSKKREHIRVVCRFRPVNQQETENNGKICVEFQPDMKTVSLTPNDAGATASTFQFDRVFDLNSTQQEVYDDVGPNIVDSILDGYNAAIIAYGQTGSGKTYTMQGPGFDQSTGKWNKNQASDNAGLVPRIVESIFDKISKADPNVEYIVVSSFVEIYLERIRDLITVDKCNLQIMEDRTKGLWVTDATEVPVANVHEVMSVIKTGLKNRFVAETSM